MVRQIRGDYDQQLLFPPSVEDWVGADHPARFLRDLVDTLDLAELGFLVPECRTGRPPYAPDLLLKVWLYGYFNGIHSSRKLERACREHMGLIWLTGMHAPDHNSLWRFCASNKTAMKSLFKRSVQVAMKAGLIGLALHAVDGTKIKTKSSNDGVRKEYRLEKMLERLDRSASDFMTEIERCEREESGEYRLPRSMQNSLRRKQMISGAVRELAESERKAAHPAEPEARFMKNKRNVDLAYNGQAMADQQSGMIVAEDVVVEGNDNGQLVPMIDESRENLGAVAEEHVADSGYFSSGQIGLAEEREYDVLVDESPGERVTQRGSDSNPYHHSRFRYDDEHDCCVCPQGNRLPFLEKKSKGKNGNDVRRYRCRDYGSCPDRWKCSKAKKGRTIDIGFHRAAVEKHRKKRENPDKRKQLKARKTIVEPVFGWIKQGLGFQRWTVTGLESVRAQWALVCATINLKKLYRYWLKGEFILSAA